MKKQILTIIAATALLGSTAALAAQDFNVRIHNQTNDILRTTLSNESCFSNTGNLDKLSLAKGGTADLKLSTDNSGTCTVRPSKFTLTFFKAGLDTPPLGQINYASTSTGNCTESGRHCFNTTNQKTLPQPTLRKNGDVIDVDIYVNNP